MQAVRKEQQGGENREIERGPVARRVNWLQMRKSARRFSARIPL
jgi:hypothetical protein